MSCSPLEETDRNRCREALIRAGLWEKIASLPQKEETYLGKDMADDGITLSGGEMQKLIMARALYKNCHLLLLDEPTAALDAISENEMYETYSTLLKNKTALFISHRLASTRFCDTILFLENGKIKECGTHDELIALGGSYAHMFEVQSQYYQETEEHILMKMKERFHAVCRFLTMVSQGNHRVLFWLIGSAFAAATLPYLSLFFSARILNLLLAKSYRACLYTVVVFLLVRSMDWGCLKKSAASISTARRNSALRSRNRKSPRRRWNWNLKNLKKPRRWMPSGAPMSLPWGQEMWVTS